MRRFGQPVFDTQSAKKQLRILLRGLGFRLREDFRHHIAAHGIGEDRTHEHRGGRLRLELRCCHSLPLERGEVNAKLVRSAFRYLAREFAHVWSLFDLTHRLTYDGAAKSQMLDIGFAPLCQLPLRIDRSIRQGREGGRFSEMQHCFTDQRFFRPELTEERDLVYPRGIGDATGSRAAEAMLGEDSGGGGKNCVTVVHGGGTNSRGAERKEST